MINDVRKKHQKEEYGVEGVRKDHINDEIRPALLKLATEAVKNWSYMHEKDSLPSEMSFTKYRELEQNFQYVYLIPENERKTSFPHGCIRKSWKGSHKTVCGYQQTGVCKHVITSSMRFANMPIPKEKVEADEKNGEERRQEDQKGAIASTRCIRKESISQEEEI